jgi:hypothetical protein
MGLTMDVLQQLVLPLFGAFGGGIGVYASIRADLAQMRATVAILERSTERAHARIDDLQQRHVAANNRQ